MNKFHPATIKIGCYTFIFASLTIGYGFLTDQWWSFMPSTILIVLLTKYFYPSHWNKKLGLDGSLTLWLVSIFFTLVSTKLVGAIIFYSLPLDYQLLFIITTCDAIGIFFQCLNEEMVFRGLLLTSTMKLIKNRCYLIIATASIFCLGHLLFYQFNLIHSNRGLLSLGALTSLFLFALSENILFLRYRSIALSLGCHFAWNINRFGGTLINKNDPEEKVIEVHSFNLIEGSIEVISLSIIFFIITSMASYLVKNKGDPSS